MFYDRIVFDVCYIYCVIGNVLIYLCVASFIIVYCFVYWFDYDYWRKKNNIIILYIIFMLFVICVVYVDEVLDFVSI